MRLRMDIFLFLSKFAPVFRSAGVAGAVLAGTAVLGWWLTPSIAFGQMQTVTGPPADAVAITVSRFGPYPAAISHVTTPFIIAVVNRSGVLDDTFSLLQIDGQKNRHGILDLHSTQSKQRDHQTIDLLPGDYELRFKSHADWVVNITITEN